MAFLPVLWLGQFRSEKIRSWPRARSPRGRTPTEAVSGHSPQVPRPGPRACRQLGVDSRDHGRLAGGGGTAPPAGTSALSERDFYFPALSTNDHCDCHDSPSQGGKPSSLRTSKSKHFSFPPRPHSHMAIPVRLPRGGPFRRDPWWLYIAPPEVSAVKAALTAAQGALHTFSTELENAGLPSPLAAGRGPAPRQQVWTKGKAGEAVLRQPRPRLSDDRAPASAAWAGHTALPWTGPAPRVHGSSPSPPGIIHASREDGPCLTCLHQRLEEVAMKARNTGALPWCRRRRRQAGGRALLPLGIA